jgi:hypothetical protein
MAGDDIYKINLHKICKYRTLTFIVNSYIIINIWQMHLINDFNASQLRFYFFLVVSCCSVMLLVCFCVECSFPLIQDVSSIFAFGRRAVSKKLQCEANINQNRKKVETYTSRSVIASFAMQRRLKKLLFDSKKWLKWQGHFFFCHSMNSFEIDHHPDIFIVRARCIRKYLQNPVQIMIPI